MLAENQPVMDFLKFKMMITTQFERGSGKNDLKWREWKKMENICEKVEEMYILDRMDRVRRVLF